MKTKNKSKKAKMQEILSTISAIGLKIEHLPKMQRIVETMQRCKFSATDLQAEARAMKGFDLLCVYYDVYERVPFEEGKNKYPVGIFPFEASNVYISLDEHEWPRKDCDESKLWTESFFAKLLPLRKDLNKCLKALGKPIIEGEYYAKGDYLSDCNWIVGIGGRYGNKLASEYHNDDERAKYRAIGTFNG